MLVCVEHRVCQKRSKMIHRDNTTMIRCINVVASSCLRWYNMIQLLCNDNFGLSQRGFIQWDFHSYKHQHETASMNIKFTVWFWYCIHIYIYMLLWCFWGRARVSPFVARDCSNSCSDQLRGKSPPLAHEDWTLQSGVNEWMMIYIYVYILYNYIYNIYILYSFYLFYLF